MLRSNQLCQATSRNLPSPRPSRKRSDLCLENHKHSFEGRVVRSRSGPGRSRAATRCRCGSPARLENARLGQEAGGTRPRVWMPKQQQSLQGSQLLGGAGHRLDTPGCPEGSALPGQFRRGRNWMTSFSNSRTFGPGLEPHLHRPQGRAVPAIRVLLQFATGSPQDRQLRERRRPKLRPRPGAIRPPQRATVHAGEWCGHEHLTRCVVRWCEQVTAPWAV